MLLIPCPNCGPRDHAEFSFGGDATVRRPADPLAASDAVWEDYLYRRDTPRGPHVEWWHHEKGCRRWIKILRDTMTHEIMGAANAGERLEWPRPC
jgi:heterotetrameric sarcosine oxidase delta subunit